MAIDEPRRPNDISEDPVDPSGKEMRASNTGTTGAGSVRTPETVGEPASGTGNEPITRVEKTPPATPQRGGQVVSSVNGPAISSETQRKLFPAALSVTGLFGWVLMTAAMVIALVIIIDLLNGPVHPVEIVQPRPVTIRNDLSVGGQVVGTTEAVVGAQSTGTVQQLFVKQGDRVKAGQQLAILNVYPSQNQQTQAQQQADRANDRLSQLEIESGTPDTTSHSTLAGARTWLQEQQGQLAQARQKLAQRQNELRQAEASQDRAQNRISGSTSNPDAGAANALKDADQRVAMAKENLHEAQEAVKVASTAISIAQSNLDDQRAKRRPSQEASAAQLRSATRNADQAQQALSQSMQPKEVGLTAPFDGVVTSISTQPGDDIGDSGLLTLDSNQLEMRAHVSEEDAQKLSVGQPATLSSLTAPGTAQGATFNGKVIQIGAAVDPSNQTVAVDIAPDAPPSWLLPGENLNAMVELSPPVNELVVPASSVATTKDGSVVFVMKNGRAVEKKVVTNQPNGQSVPVISGLDQDDRVVLAAQGIKPGERLKDAKRSGTAKGSDSQNNSMQSGSSGSDQGGH